MKIALVYAFNSSQWFSCKIILKNLLAAYEEQFGKDQILHVHYGYDYNLDFEGVKKIKSGQVDKVIFLDHKPTPLTFLNELTISSDDGSEGALPDLEYICHVYGDFPLLSGEWRAVLKKFNNQKVKFICASERQQKFIQQFVNQDTVVFKSPFPVDKKDFYFDENLREKTRKELGLKYEKTFVYIGRLSQQKRIIELIENFDQAILRKTIPSDSKLFIMGEFDTLGVTYLTLGQVHGEYFRKVDQAIMKSSNSRNIILLDNQPHEKLNSFYNMADCFISLSTYHDEDYGMAVAEAMCTGLPCVLTSWAGYASFKIPGDKSNSFVPVKLTDRSPEFLSNDVQNAIRDSYAYLNPKKREALSLKAYGLLEVNSVANVLKYILELDVESFEGNSRLMIELSNQVITKGPTMFKDDTDLRFNSTYHKVYQVYVE